jgi:hypothetical protein
MMTLNRKSLTRDRALKPKKCRNRDCGKTFMPVRTMQAVCSPHCGLALAAKQREQKAARANREERKSIRVALEKAKTRGTHLKELQAAFNAWIRLRDAGQPCIACGRYHQGQNHAGHYRSNVHLTCQPCNVHLSGNLIQMRIGMIKKIGLARVEWLEGQHEPKKYTLQEILEMKAFYRAEVRRLKREAA